MKKGEIVFFGVSVAFFSFMLYQTLGLAGHGRAGEFGSGTWPTMALGISTLLSVILLVKSVRKAGNEGDIPEALTPEAAAELRCARATVFWCVVCFLAYLVLIPMIGFILATFLFVGAFAVALGERRRMVLIISPFLLTTIIVSVFAKFITIPFPRGIGFFAGFSRLFY